MSVTRQSIAPGTTAALALLLNCFFISSAAATDSLPTVNSDAVQGTTMTRRNNEVILNLLPEATSGHVRIPLLHGQLRRIDATPSAASVSLHPEQKFWILKWKDKRPLHITLIFDQTPLLSEEMRPVEASGDGSFMLHAWQAATYGEKIRYEPQTFKNTVGYWVGENDSATWRVHILRPGKFNFAILQGCGNGQGGSVATATLTGPTDTTDHLQFEVLETGHFQNFQWRTPGQLTATTPGVYKLTIAPHKIRKAALMDVRSVHLIRLPEPKSTN